MSRPCRPRVLGHRGASGHAAENSLEAFRLARELGAEGIELDVHATADGFLVVHHDPILHGGGRIRELRLDEVQSHGLANGEAIPTLEDVLAAVPELETWVEVKALAPEHDDRLIDLIAGAKGSKTCAIHSFDHRLIARIHRKRPTLRLGILSTAYLLEPVRALQQTGATALWQEWSLIDAELVEIVHAAGAEVIAWTVNDAEIARRLAALGVDALCGNWPERLAVIARERSERSNLERH